MMDQIFEAFDTPDRPGVSNMKKSVKPKEIPGGAQTSPDPFTNNMLNY
jgi:hypothetical protein